MTNLALIGKLPLLCYVLREEEGSNSWRKLVRVRKPTERNNIAKVQKEKLDECRRLKVWLNGVEVKESYASEFADSMINDDADDSSTRIDPGSHKEHPKNVNDDDEEIEKEMKDDDIEKEEKNDDVEKTDEVMLKEKDNDEAGASVKRITFGYPWPELEGKRFGMIQGRYGPSACCLRDQMGTPTQYMICWFDWIELHVSFCGSFDVIVGMDWLSKRKFVIVCYEKVVRIPSPFLWAEIGESSLTGLELVLEMADKVVLIKEKLKAEERSSKELFHFGKKGKLAPRYVGPFEILERTGLVAYRLRLPEELNSMHDTFYVSNLKKCLADANLHVPLDEIKVDKTLRFIEEPVEIMDREIRKLKHRKVVLVKVRGNSKRGPEFTWEHEDQMRIKRITFGYPWPELEGKRFGMIQGRWCDKATVRRDLQLEDANGVDCLPNATSFEQLTLVGIYIAPSHTKKVFANMKRQGKDFSGRVTPLFSTMMVQAQQELGEENVADEAVYKERDDSLERATTTATVLDAEQDRGNISKTQSKATPNELSSIGTSSGGGPRRQDTMGDRPAQTSIGDYKSKKRVKKLERKKKSRTHGLKRLYKVGLSARIDSSDDEASLGDQEDASKQGRKIHDIDADEDITLENVHDADMFGVHDLDVSDAKDLSDVDITLAQALAELKSAKPKAVTTAATTTTIGVTRSKAKGLVIQEQEQASTPITSSKDKDKVGTDYELAQRLQAEEQEELTIKEKSKLFQQLLKKRRKFFAAKRLFDKAMKRVNTFVDMDTKLVGGSEVREESSKTREESSSKRASDELE
ncbi:hypothetical protein Tco_0409838 [Tanacetum coccineum]